MIIISNNHAVDDNSYNTGLQNESVFGCPIFCFSWDTWWRGLGSIFL